ncbi:MAG: SGNH/GDSL hydrolase family protein [Pseudonocardiales bacterium]|nr:MAG: SGNH/GDSL hydrolase family protein [Pseudonocardiales bacterium]
MARTPSRSDRPARAVARVLTSLALLALVACTSATNGRGQRASATSGIAQHSVVAFIGDSYTVGAGASDPSRRWSSLVAGHFGWVEKNFGVGGTGYAAPPPYLDRVAAVAVANPSAVVVSGGFNDLYHGVADPQFQQAAYATFAALRSTMPHARILAIRPFYPAAPPPPGVTMFAQDVRRAVIAVGGSYLDIGSPLQGHQADIGPDQVHPNDAGYRLLAEAVEGAFSTQH